MTAITIIRKGGDLKFVFDRDGLDITGFVCAVTVKRFPDDPPPMVSLVVDNRVIPPLDNTWPGILTSTDIDAIQVQSGFGLFWLIAKITNAVTGEERQVPERFQITKNWV